MHMSQLPHSNQHFKSNIQTICVIELINDLINPLWTKFFFRRFSRHT